MDSSNEYIFIVRAVEYTNFTSTRSVWMDSPKEIMAQFGFTSPVQVTTYYLDSLIETGQAKAIVGRNPRAGKAGMESKIITVNKRGSLIIPKEKAAELGYKVGDTFSVSQTLLAERKNWWPAACIWAASTIRMTGLPRRLPTFRAVASSGDRWT